MTEYTITVLQHDIRKNKGDVAFAIEPPVPFSENFDTSHFCEQILKGLGKTASASAQTNSEEVEVIARDFTKKTYVFARLEMLREPENIDRLLEYSQELIKQLPVEQEAIMQEPINEM